MRTTADDGGAATHLFGNGQETGGLWYHDHAMGITRLNVSGGLAGQYWIRDQWDTGLVDNLLGLPTGEFEVPLTFSEKQFLSDGRQSYRTTPLFPQGVNEGAYVADRALVNGVVWPYMAVDRGLYRFRLLNGSSWTTWDLEFENGMRFWVIGSDGGLFDAPVATTNLRIGSGERYDVLVDFSGLDAGERVVLRNIEPPTALSLAILPKSVPYLMEFRATANRGFRGAVPSTLRGGTGQPPVVPATPTPQRDRHIALTQGLMPHMTFPIAMAINNQTWQTPDIDTPRQGTIERWNFINTTTEPHPMHIHLVHFRVQGRQRFNAITYTLLNLQPPVIGSRRWAPSAEPYTIGATSPPEPWEMGWKDTVMCPPQQITRIIVRWPTADELGFDPDASFDLPADPAAPGEQEQTANGYVYHCHVTDHEDMNMMVRFRLVN